LQSKIVQEFPEKREFELYVDFTFVLVIIIIFLYQRGMREGWARDRRGKGMGRRGTEGWGEGMKSDGRGTGEGQERDRRETGEGQERNRRGTGEGQGQETDR
jgi:hypothetical protein